MHSMIRPQILWFSPGLEFCVEKLSWVGVGNPQEASPEVTPDQSPVYASQYGAQLSASSTSPTYTVVLQLLGQFVSSTIFYANQRMLQPSLTLPITLALMYTNGICSPVWETPVTPPGPLPVLVPELVQSVLHPIHTNGCCILAQPNSSILLSQGGIETVLLKRIDFSIYKITIVWIMPTTSCRACIFKITNHYLNQIYRFLLFHNLVYLFI